MPVLPNWKGESDVPAAVNVAVKPLVTVRLTGWSVNA